MLAAECEIFGIFYPPEPQVGCPALGKAIGALGQHREGQCRVWGLPLSHPFINSEILALCRAELQLPSLRSCGCIPVLPFYPVPLNSHIYSLLLFQQTPLQSHFPHQEPFPGHTLYPRGKNKFSIFFLFFFPIKPELFAPQNPHKNLLHLSCPQVPPEPS